MEVRSSYPDIEIPEMSLTEFVLGRARELGEKPALVDALGVRRVAHHERADAVSRAIRGSVRG